MTADFTPFPPGDVSLMSARPTPDFAAIGYVESEYVVRGTARSQAGETADYATRLVVRRPSDPARASGTLLAEWLNVSSGQDSAPDWTYLEAEILRRGHTWVGVSAQYVGVEGGGGSVDTGLGSPGLKGNDPSRYGGLHHPGDAYMFDIFRQAVAGLDVPAEVRLAVGESQSAVALTTYVNVVQPAAPYFDGFLIHSRGGVAAPLGEPGTGLVMDEVLRGKPVPIRDDLDVPVHVVVTEGDLFDRIGFLPARQHDTDTFRLWEVAGTSHADGFIIGDFEEFLGCEVPVNRGQQTFVLRAALRHLDGWARGGDPPPAAPRLETTNDGFVHDDNRNVRGGVRTPRVDAPVEVLSGRPWPGASVACRLFGSTITLPAERLKELYVDRAAYLAAYARATDAAIEAGFVLAEDREALLADAQPLLVES
ncbi:MAG TPA: alpha/beta hydrolase domain-containing protein [Nocardioides sp.]|nr:alpha/beta hydrolase domain-containing protein [Nocardioides sp.]